MALRLTLPHRYDFGADTAVVGENLLRPDAWDSLRLKTFGPFSIAADRGELDRQAEAHPEIRDRMRLLDALLRRLGARTLVSYGAGGAIPERWLLRLNPERRLVITDYAPGTVEQLRLLLPEAEVRRHDLLADPPLDGDVHLFHRIDTELDNADWRAVYERFRDRTIVVVATGVLSTSGIPRQVVHAIRARNLTRAGWTRTRGAFESLWRATHRGTPVRFADLEGWVLEPR